MTPFGHMIDNMREGEEHRADNEQIIDYIFVYGGDKELL